LPLPPQPVLQAYFILNTSEQRWPRVGRGSTLGSRYRCGLLDGTGQLLDALVDCLLVVYRGNPWESLIKASLDCSPVYSPEVGAFQQVLKG
jgi:hypothetical protein